MATRGRAVPVDDVGSTLPYFRVELVKLFYLGH